MKRRVDGREDDIRVVEEGLLIVFNSAIVIRWISDVTEDTGVEIRNGDMIRDSANI